MNIIKLKLHNLFSDRRFSEILTGSIWALSARVVVAVLAMATSIIIARCYGADILGIVAVLNSFMTLATIFTILGTNTSLLRLIPEHMAKYSPTSAFNVYRKTHLFVAVVSILSGTILLLGSGFIAGTLFSKPHLKFYFGLGSVFIIFNSLMILNTQAVRGVRLVRAFAFMQLLPSLLKLFLLAFLTIFFFNHDNPIYAVFASNAFTAVVGAWIMNRTFKQKIAPTDVAHPMPMKDILSISLPMLMTASMTHIIAQTGVIMIGIFHSEADIGYYATAVRLATLTSFILQAVNSMAGPKFSELFHSNKLDELFYVAKKSAKLIFWTTVPILLGFIVLGKQILHIAFGSEFTIAYPALSLLVLGQFVNSISGSTGLFLNMTGNQIVFRNIVFFAAIANIGLNLLLTPKYAIIGSAIAAMSSLMLWNISILIYIKMKFGKTTGYFPMYARFQALTTKMR